MNVTDMVMLYAYNRWANRRVMAASKLLSVEQFLAPSDFPHGSLQNTLGHMIRTEWYWCALLRGESTAGQAQAAARTTPNPTEVQEEDLPPVTVLEARWNEIQAETESYIAGLDDADLARAMPLKSGGVLTVWQVLINLYTHCAQHRGEVAQILTRHGCSPGDIDFLFFALEQQSL